jgi:hypothetical protein
MARSVLKIFATILGTFFFLSHGWGTPLTITVQKTPPLAPEEYQMGDARRPDGETLTLDSKSLRLNGQPWTPVMGEFHYSRMPADEWREELLKMKAGGVDIVSTYVFWIHHEEIEGQWDWSGCRDLHHFVELCGEVGLKVIVRCGPWCHGEVRNGGQPDWLLQKGWQLRSDDPQYLAQVKILYGQIAKQLSGLLWKDGGPVIGIQFENEYSGPASHLLTLKKLGREAGLDVPFYTKTGWPELRTPLPFGELIPLYGVYTEGFWDREITPMPGSYWAGFHFSKLRVNNDIGTDQLGRRRAQDPPDVERYPYLTCEIGGGMMNSYHRRILIDPADIESATLVKIGSGSVSPGYYMYHGGENPEGKLTTLEESQATGYWNDMPVKNYDFQAPLGEYGQIRPQYHLLRRLHLFLHEWGPSLAQMGVALPDVRPAGKDDVSTLRWSVRTDGDSGFVFVNNYERLRDLPEKTNVQFALKLSSGTLLFPQNPVTIPATSRFFWPFNFDLGQGVKLISATAQPLSAIQDGDMRVVFFAENKGIPAEFVFDKSTSVKSFGSNLINKGDYQVASRVVPGRKPVFEIMTPGGKLQLVLLNDSDSLSFWKGTWQGRDRVILSKAGLVLDGPNLRITSTQRDDLSLGIYPALQGIMCNGKYLRAVNDGIFARFTPSRPEEINLKANVEMIQPAGPLRKIVLGKIEQPVAAAPEDSDFAQAAIWRIKLPDNLDLSVDPILRLKYVGDVARITLSGKLLTDDFYNGNAFEVGLGRYASGILSGDLRLAILPLQKNAPIYLAKKAQPDFGTATSLAALSEMEIVPRYTVTLSEREEVSQAAN